jgi:hypothetical protein
MPSWNHQLSPSNKDGSKPVSLLRKGFSSIGAPGLVELEGRSLIAPNTSFARAVVLSDNAPSTRRPIDTTTTSRQHQQQRPVPPILRVDKQVEQRPASNLTLLLSQPERFEPLRDATQDKKTQKSTTLVLILLTVTCKRQTRHRDLLLLRKCGWVRRLRIFWTAARQRS